MRADGLCFKAAVLVFASLMPFCTSGINQMFNVLQPVMTKTWHCATNDSACCVDCIALGDDNYNLMFSTLYLSAIVFVPIGGYLTDSLGNAMAVAMSLSCLCGCCLIAAGSCVRESPAKLPLMFAGFAFYGYANMASYTARNRFLAVWFTGANLQLAYGLAESLNHLSSLPSFALTEQLRELTSLQWTLWCCAFVALLGVAFAATVTGLDAWGTRQLRLSDQLASERRSVAVGDLRHFGCEFWLVAACYAFMACTFFTLQDNVVELVHEKFGHTKQSAAVIGGTLRYVGIVGGPAVGLLVDRAGRSSFFVTAAAFTMMPALLLLACTDTHPVVGALIIGVCYSFVTPACAGSVPLILDRKWLGIGFSFVFCFEAILSVTLHAAVGAVLGHELRLPLAEKQIRWLHALCLLLAVTFAAFVCGAALSLLSWCRGSPLATGKTKEATEPMSEISSSGSDSEEGGGSDRRRLVVLKDVGSSTAEYCRQTAASD